MSKVTLVLENGSCYSGCLAGSNGERIGEVVLNTAVVGYQEMITDPANSGKILVLTYPLIGNYGTAPKFYESEKSRLSGLVIKEMSRTYSNYQAQGSLADFLKNENVFTASDVDTRTLAVDIRDNGEMLGIISSENVRKEELLKKLKDVKQKYRKNYIREISVKKPTKVNTVLGGPEIAVLDLGMINSFIKQLKILNCGITLLPYDTPPEEILKTKPDGLIVSGGPEGDVSLAGVSETIKALLGKIPMFGISTGHQAIALALGAKIKKMRVGHHGANYPVKSPCSLRGEITVQNHSFVVDEGSIKNRKDVTVTHRNINDETIEGLESKSFKFISCQYYPVSPGFDETNEAYRRFLKLTGRVFKKSLISPREVNYAKA